MSAFPTFRFWLGWTLLHGGVMGGGHLLLLAAVRKHSFMFTPYAGVLVLGIAQPILLRTRVRWLWVWPLLAVVAAALTFVVNWFFPVLLGLLLGLLQWPLLAKAGFRRTLLWPLLGGAVWALGVVLSWLIINPTEGIAFGQTPPPPRPIREAAALALQGLFYGAATGWVFALMRPTSTGLAGWLFYDGACPFCLRWVKRLGFVARQGCFELVPLQSETACQDLGLAAGVLPHEMKLRLADGRVLGGVDAIIVLAESAGWTAPLGWLLRGPGVNPLAWRVYRRIAANRYCLGGACVVPPQPGRS